MYSFPESSNKFIRKDTIFKIAFKVARKAKMLVDSLHFLYCLDILT